MTDPKSGAPGGVRQLSRLLSQAAKREAIPESRLRGWLSARVLSAALARSRDEDGQPLFLIRGGIAMELRLDMQARATQDFDAVILDPVVDIEEAVRSALGDEWHGFTFTPTPPEPIRHSSAQRTLVQLDYRGQPWGKVKLEVAHAEGELGQEHSQVAVKALPWARLPLPTEAACVSLRYVVAQKIHACTEPPRDDAIPNERFRDVMDLLLIESEIRQSNPIEVSTACQEIFHLRGTHAWPPILTAPESWEPGYATLCRDNGFEPSDVKAGVARVNLLIDWIAGDQHRA